MFATGGIAGRGGGGGGSWDQAVGTEAANHLPHLIAARSQSLGGALRRCGRSPLPPALPSLQRLLSADGHLNTELGVGHSASPPTVAQVCVSRHILTSFLRWALCPTHHRF